MVLKMKNETRYQILFFFFAMLFLCCPMNSGLLNSKAVEHYIMARASVSA